MAQGCAWIAVRNTRQHCRQPESFASGLNVQTFQQGESPEACRDGEALQFRRDYEALGRF